MAKMTWNEATSLDESLASLETYFRSPPKMAELLSGGLTNRCWKVTSTQGESFVWRPVSAASHAFGISRMKEHRLLESLEECHLAPDAAYLNHAGLLVEWIEEDDPDSSFPVGEIELVSTLARIHSVDIHSKPIPLFSYTAKVDGYWHQLKSKPVEKEFEEIYLSYREQPIIEPVEPTLCHMDLGIYNLIMTSKGIRVIDWEYAGVADPRMDLAMTIDISEIDMPRAVENYCKIRRIEDTGAWLVGINQWMPRNRMMAMLWYLIGHQIWQDERYLEEAHRIKLKF
ncbi:phosphotransferase [Vibrio sp. JC009]|uniref:phosphotransferase n=1 Tax=Vibrio sp. JC009 TaxID=2912314 RepID=UPI0023AEA8F7|nr:phosphotransferase [Vibrio sp. JC009]WED20822.1 phosphotransferase [Vibrio sp. JC009]